MVKKVIFYNGYINTNLRMNLPTIFGLDMFKSDKFPFDNSRV